MVGVLHRSLRCEPPILPKLGGDPPPLLINLRSLDRKLNNIQKKGISQKGFKIELTFQHVYFINKSWRVCVGYSNLPSFFGSKIEQHTEKSILLRVFLIEVYPARVCGKPNMEGMCGTF